MKKSPAVGLSPAATPRMAVVQVEHSSTMTAQTLGRSPYLADKRVKVPVVVAAIETLTGRLTISLTQAHVPSHRLQIER